jgi:hypothetical protein
MSMLDRQVWAFRRGGLRLARQLAFGGMEERVGCADAVERRKGPGWPKMAQPRSRPPEAATARTTCRSRSQAPTG